MAVAGERWEKSVIINKEKQNGKTVKLVRDKRAEQEQNTNISDALILKEYCRGGGSSANPSL